MPSLPNPTTRKGWPHHRAQRPLLFSNSGVGSFASHINRSVKVLWGRTYGFLFLSKKNRKSNHLQMSLKRRHFLLSRFKDPECWSGRGLNLRPPSQQTSALPTELTRRRTKLYLLKLPKRIPSPYPSDSGTACLIICEISLFVTAANRKAILLVTYASLASFARGAGSKSANRSRV